MGRRGLLCLRGSQLGERAYQHVGGMGLTSTARGYGPMFESLLNSSRLRPQKPLARQAVALIFGSEQGSSLRSASRKVVEDASKDENQLTQGRDVIRAGDLVARLRIHL